MSNYRICNRCVMDTSATEIIFYQDGRCSFCKDFDERVSQEIHKDLPDNFLSEFAKKVKKAGKNNEYDCLIGISGGVDSSYVAHLTKELGLRPLAIHLDNGWNSELSVSNIENLCDKLDIDLETHVLNWKEFKDIQTSFLKSSISNIEIPTDHAIWAVLVKKAAKLNIKYIISGSNAATESIMPNSWLYTSKDSKVIRSIHKKFGKLRMKNYPYLTTFDYFEKLFVRGIKWVPILNYTDFDKEKAKALLVSKYDWRDYGGKHYESIFTRFFHSYYLIEKFGYDLRRAYSSAEICSGQLSRKKALEDLKKAPAETSMVKSDIEYVKKKLGFSDKDFELIIRKTNLSFEHYPNNHKIWTALARYVKYFRKRITEIHE
jgi:N-acetyl sugar amidotransferase